jgi:hypothetical protein
MQEKQHGIHFGVPPIIFFAGETIREAAQL